MDANKIITDLAKILTNVFEQENRFSHIGYQHLSTKITDGLIALPYTEIEIQKVVDELQDEIDKGQNENAQRVLGVLTTLRDTVFGLL